jgi:hypothetical protein
MKTIFALITAILLVACEPLNEVYDGDSYLTAMTVSASSRPRLREAEISWMQHRHPEGFVILHRETKHKKGKEYDLITIRTSGKRSWIKTYYFHVKMQK